MARKKKRKNELRYDELLQIRIPSADLAALHKIANEKRTTITALTRQLLVEFMQREEILP